MCVSRREASGRNFDVLGGHQSVKIDDAHTHTYISFKVYILCPKRYEIDIFELECAAIG